MSDSIEANVEHAHTNVAGANIQLGKASLYQVRNELLIVAYTQDTVCVMSILPLVPKAHTVKDSICSFS